MKRLGVFAIGLLLLSGSRSPAIAGDARSNNLALLVEAQGKVSSRLASASVEKGSAQYALRGELKQIDHLIAALKAGEDVDPKRIEQVLKRARVIH